MLKTIQSQIIKDLVANLASDNNQTVTKFWDNLKQHESPLVDVIPGDETNVWVTFVFRAEEPVENVIVYWPLSSLDYSENKMEQISETDVAELFESM